LSKTHREIIIKSGKFVHWPSPFY